MNRLPRVPDRTDSPFDQNLLFQSLSPDAKYVLFRIDDGYNVLMDPTSGRSVVELDATAEALFSEDGSKLGRIGGSLH
jgi:hypothetical protein